MTKTQIRRRTARAEFKPVRQRTQYTCMAASLKMALEAQGFDCTEDELCRIMGIRPGSGAYWEQVIAACQHVGMRATLICPATLQHVKDFTDKGAAVLIGWNPEDRPWSHASVIFDVTEDEVHVADPNIPDPDKTVRVMDRGTFYKKWCEKWPDYIVRRPALAIEREIDEAGEPTAPYKEDASLFQEEFATLLTSRGGFGGKNRADIQLAGKTASKNQARSKQALQKLSKMASEANFTKRTQKDCTTAINKLKKLCKREAKALWRSDEDSVDFLKRHANRPNQSAILILDALGQIGPRLAGKRKRGLYGFPQKLVKKCLKSCGLVQQEAGKICLDLHKRRLEKYDRITGYLDYQASQDCPYAKMLLNCYPDPQMKL